MTLFTCLWIAAVACSTDAIPTAPSGPEQNQLVSTISIHPSDAVIQPDDREVLQAQIRGARGQVVNGRQITWTTSDPSIIDIDASGNILAVNEGTATITARHKTVAGSATVDVRGDVVEILFDEVPAIVEGQAVTVDASYRYSNGALRPASRLNWWSDDRDILRVDGDGELLGVGVGAVNVYAAARGRSASRRVEVGKRNVAEVIVQAPAEDIEVGERRELWAEIRSTTGERLYRKLAWSSSNSSVATVDKNAGVTGIAAGTVTITATVAGVSGSVDVTIVSPATSGGSGGSTGGSESGGSSGGSTSGGSATGGSTSSAQSVPADITDLAVVTTNLRSIALTFTRVDDGTGSDALYEVRFDVADSYDWSRAQVAVKGDCDAIPAGSPGETVKCWVEGLLAATDYSFQVVPYRVSGGETVYGELSNVANGRTDDPGVVVDVTPSAFSIDVGQSKQMAASVTDEFGNPLSATVSWTSTSSGVASVTSSGMVTANAAGSATIRATALSTSGSSDATIMQPATDSGSGGSNDSGSSGSGSGGSTSTAAPGPGWSPQGQVICDEDFSRFSDWNAFMSGAGCISNKGHLDGWGRNNIDVDSNGLWYRFRADPMRCGDQIVGQANIPLPAGTREVWLEFTTIFSSNFQTANPNCSKPAPDYKYLLVWLPGGNNAVSCGNGRAELKMGTNGGQIAASTVGFSQCDDVKVNPDGSTQTVRQNGANAYFDGQPHTYRLSFRMLGNSRYHVYNEIDGVVTHDYITNSISDVGLEWGRIMMGSNRNLGAIQDMFLHWRSMKVWVR